MSGRDGCDDSDDDDEPLVDPASTTTGGFADALTEVEAPYLPITVTSKGGSHEIICYFDLSGDIRMAPMCYNSAAIVARFTDTGVYCVVPLTEASGVPQYFLQNGCSIHCDGVVQAFLDGETDLMEAWGYNSTVPPNVRQAICDGLCFYSGFTPSDLYTPGGAAILPFYSGRDQGRKEGAKAVQTAAGLG